MQPTVQTSALLDFSIQNTTRTDGLHGRCKIETEQLIATMIIIFALGRRLISLL